MLAYVQVCGRGEDRASDASTGGEIGGDGWVRSGSVTPLSCRVLVGMVSTLARSIGSSSWGWVKSALGVEKYLSVVLTSLCICTIFQILS